MTEVIRPKTFHQARKRYIAKNIGKSLLLSCIAVVGARTTYNLFVHGIVDNAMIHTLGLMYATPDVFALWWMPKEVLAPTTIKHHRVVGVFAFVNLLHDYSTPSHWHAMLFYAYMSSLTGIVNLYLGVRFLLKRDSPTQDNHRSNLAVCSLALYVISCFFNWAFQLYTVVWSLHVNALSLNDAWAVAELSYQSITQCAHALLLVLSLASYGVLVWFVVYDDLVLMQKLFQEIHRFSPPSTTSGKQFIDPDVCVTTVLF